MQPSSFKISQLPTHEARLPTANMVQQPVNAGYTEDFNVQAGKATGILHIICGILVIPLGAAMWTFYTLAGYSSIGIWSGTLIQIPAGILGIYCKGKNICIITSYMMMSLFSCVSSAVMMVLAVIDAAPSGCGPDDKNPSHVYPRGFSACIALSSVLAFIGLVEVFTSLVAIAYCCRGVCFCTCVPLQSANVNQDMAFTAVPSQPNMTLPAPPVNNPYHYIMEPEHIAVPAGGVIKKDATVDTDGAAKGNPAKAQDQWVPDGTEEHNNVTAAEDTDPTPDGLELLVHHEYLNFNRTHAASSSSYSVEKEGISGNIKNSVVDENGYLEVMNKHM